MSSHKMQGNPSSISTSFLQGIPASNLLKDRPLCVFLDTFYEKFLHSLYAHQPSLQTASFKDQLQAIIQTNNGDSDFYSSGLRKHGWRAEQIVINSPWMQAAWARENHIPLSGEDLIVEQLATLKPDVVYCQDMHQLSEPFLKRIRPHCKLLVGQIATSIIHIPLHCYDVVVSSILPIVEHVRSLGITSFYVPLAFSPRVSAALQLPTDYHSRPVPCSFVGSIASDMHMKRAHFLTHLASQLPLSLWGVGVELLPGDSPLRACYQGQAWGPDLFQVLGSSKITVNCHGEVLYDRMNPKNSTDEFANNMRLYEATGMGALLITEYRQNLGDQFDVGKEIVVYRDTDECAALIKYYLERPDEAAKIAAAGQARTLQDHSYALRMEQLSKYLMQLLSLQSEEQKEIDYNTISYDFKPLVGSTVRPELESAWQDASIPKRQRALVRKELGEMYKGNLVMPFKSMKTVLSRVICSKDKVLEIGCSSGYYSEVLSYLIPKPFSYTGVDYSAPMIEMAKSYYPNEEFLQASGDSLPYTKEEFDVVISGCILLHCPNYLDHIRESTRVTKRALILSRTPICKRDNTQYFTKKAYGVETVELVFNESEITNAVRSHGFRLTHYLVLDENAASDRYTVTYAFVRTS